MAVSPGSSITASNYNILQNRIEQLLGTGSDDFGYGQVVTSSQVTGAGAGVNGEIVDSEHMRNLWNDMDRAYKHQNGSNLSITQITTGDLIGADVSTEDLPVFDTVDTDGDGRLDYTLSNIDNTQGFNDYLTVMTGLEDAKDTVAVAETFPDAAIKDDQRTTSFNGLITSTFTVTFGTSTQTEAQRINAMRHFFNAGGQILIEGSVSNVNNNTAINNDSVQRNEGWQTMIEGPQVIRFGHSSTTIDGASTGVTFPAGAIGFRQLTTTEEIIFKRDASAGDYEDSYWQIKARIDSGTPYRLRFFLELLDDGPETNADAGQKGSIEPGVVEPVTVDIFFDYGARRPRSTDFESDGTTRRFSLPFPTFSVVNTFE